MYKPGTRVRYVAVLSKDQRDPARPCENHVPVGAEGVVDGVTLDHFHGPGYLVRFDRYPAKHATGQFFCYDWMLAPLTNPGTERDAAAERFIESLKRLAREPITLTEKEMERVSGGRAVRTSGCAPRAFSIANVYGVTREYGPATGSEAK